MPSVLLLITLMLPAWGGHGDLHERIAELSLRIAASPRDPKLRFDRAELYRQHLEFENALADCRETLTLDPDFFAVYLEEARIRFDMMRFEEALAAGDRFLAKLPTHGEAHLIRARCLSRLGRAAESAAAYDEALRLLPRQTPEVYIERAREQVRDEKGGLDRALEGLARGLEVLGPAISLELTALELEVTGRRHDAALARVDRLMSNQKRTESWWLRRAEICVATGRAGAAREAFVKGLAAVESLSPRIRKLKSTQLVVEKLRAGLAALDDKE